MTIPIAELQTALAGFIDDAWPDVTPPILYERQAENLLLDKAQSPRAAVVWREPTGAASWSPDVGILRVPVDVYYLIQSAEVGGEEAAMQAKAAALLANLIAAGNRWLDVPDMHAWKLKSSASEHSRSGAWRAAGWASARIAIEVEFDYER